MKIKVSADTILTKEILIKILSQTKAETARLEKLENYYLGKHSILSRTVSDSSKPNNRIVNPYCSYITDTLCGYICGEPITYSSSDTAALESLQMILTYNDAAAEDMEIAKAMSIYGVAYELVYIDEDGITRFATINPKDMVIVYDDSIEDNILYAIRKIPCYDIIHNKEYYKIEVYSNTTIFRYTSDSLFSSLVLEDTIPHYFQQVPVIEYNNNSQKMGDFEQVISLVDAYDSLESDSLNDYDYFVDAYLMLTGVTASADEIAQMKENRVLLFDEDSKAEWLIKNSSDTQIENLKSRINADIHKFAKVPDLSDENFASNASGVAIKYKLYGTETLCSTKERMFQKGLQKRIELIFAITAVKDTSYDWRAITINFTRNIPSNVAEIADSIMKLSGIVSNKTLLAQVPFVTNVQEELDSLEQEREVNPFYNFEIEKNAGSAESAE